jgi:hypothetical protein
MNMNSQTLGLRTAGIIFGIFCLIHLWRVFAHVDVAVGTHHLPIWGSVVGLIVAGGLSIWMFRLSANRGG